LGLASALTIDRLRTLRVVSDGSRRSRELIGGLVAGGYRPTAGAGAAGGLLLATDAVGARRALANIARRPRPPAQIYLAPWLLDGGVLSSVQERQLPPVLVASAIDPMSPLADRYRAALAAAGAGARPSLAGLLGFASVAEGTTNAASSIQLYAATPIGFLPGILDVGHQHAQTDWLTTGTLVSVTRPVLLPRPCAHSSA
jgi:hypothetical protein